MLEVDDPVTIPNGSPFKLGENKSRAEDVVEEVRDSSEDS